MASPDELKQLATKQAAIIRKQAQLMLGEAAKLDLWAAYDLYDNKLALQESVNALEAVADSCENCRDLLTGNAEVPEKRKTCAHCGAINGRNTRFCGKAHANASLQRVQTCLNCNATFALWPASASDRGGRPPLRSNNATLGGLLTGYCSWTCQDAGKRKLLHAHGVEKHLDPLAVISAEVGYKTTEGK